MSNLLSFEDLKKYTGYEKKADVVTCLRRAGIRFHTGKRGMPFTTTGLIEQAANGNETSKNDDLKPQMIEI